MDARRLPLDEWVLPGVRYRSTAGDIVFAAIIVALGGFGAMIGLSPSPKPTLPFGSWPGHWAIAIASGVLLVFKRRIPVAVAIGEGALLCSATALVTGVFSLAPAVALFDAIYASMLYASAAGRRVVYALAALVAVAQVAIAPPPDPSATVASMLAMAALIGFPAMWGTAVRQRDELVQVERERADAIARAAAAEREAAVRAERNEVAGELHDEIAARLSAISLQASALQAGDDDPRRAAAVRAMREASREALDELRRLIGVLAQDRTDEGRMEAPAAAPLGDEHDPRPALRAQADAFGAKARFDGDPGRLSGPVANALERMGREAIANAARHAPGAPIDVRLRGDDASVTLEVENPIVQPAVATAGTGLGTDLMTARWTALGGTGSIGRIGDRWRVAATIPLREDGGDG